MIVQSSSADEGETDITFTIKREDIKKAINLLKKNKKISYEKIIQNEKKEIIQEAKQIADLKELVTSILMVSDLSRQRE